MTDRKLLELAAKAAGIKPAGFDGQDIGWYKPDTGKMGYWDPLEDDGDALRIAVRLGIKIEHYKQSGEHWANDCCCTDFYSGDASAATRRAIVRAAAEIGKQL